jgi:hypothetical protein
MQRSLRRALIVPTWGHPPAKGVSPGAVNQVIKWIGPRANVVRPPAIGPRANPKTRELDPDPVERKLESWQRCQNQTLELEGPGPIRGRAEHSWRA